MAIFGIGAMYDSDRDVSDSFLNNGLACVGWSYNDAPSLHQLMRSITAGDIIYLKSHPPNVGLIIKAVGIVTDPEVFAGPHGDACVRVHWAWRGPEIRMGRIHDAYNVHNNTLYEEWNPEVRDRVVGLIVTQFPTLAVAQGSQ